MHLWHYAHITVLEQPKPTETAPDQPSGEFFTQLEFTINPQNNMLILLNPLAEGLESEDGSCIQFL